MSGRESNKPSHVNFVEPVAKALAFVPLQESHPQTKVCATESIQNQEAFFQLGTE